MHHTAIIPPTQYRALLFDFDMTIADGSDWIVHCYHTILSQHGYTQVTAPQIRRTIGMTIEDSFAQLTGVTDALQLTAWQQAYRALCKPRMAQMTHLFPDALTFLTQAHARGLRLGIVSTKEANTIRWTLQHEGIEDLFALVIGREHVHAPKPSPEGLLAAATQLALAPSEICYYGDTPLDALAAQRAGMPYVGIAKGSYTPAELSAYPHVAIATTYDTLLAQL